MSRLPGAEAAETEEEEKTAAMATAMRELFLNIFDIVVLGGVVGVVLRVYVGVVSGCFCLLVAMELS
jgi:hypothetical protein